MGVGSWLSRFVERQLIAQFLKIELLVGLIGGLMEQIAQSSREQAAGLAEVDLAVGQMDQVIQQNAAMAEQASASSRGLAHDAVRLEAQVEHFQVSTDQKTWAAA